MVDGLDPRVEDDPEADLDSGALVGENSDLRPRSFLE